MNAHDLIEGLARNFNTRDEDRLAEIFTDSAVVQDGGREYRGASGIRHWIRSTITRYAVNLRILTVSGQGQSWLFDAEVSGTFEGSPIRLEHSLVIEGGKIARLDI